MKSTFTNYRSIALVIVLMITFGVYGQRKMEELNRGVLAVRDGSNNYISWRILGTELRDVTYNVYRDGTQINSEPIEGASNYIDNAGSISSQYTVSAIVEGIEQSQSEAATVLATNYLDIPVRAINGSYDTYELNDASVGDLDGDGDYEVVVKRLSLADLGSTDYHYLEAYELDGTFMWAINLGPNIHNKVEVNFLVYDFDEDGKAEVITRTSDGMIDGVGNNIGDRDNDGRIDDYAFAYNSSYYRVEGPDYISVFDGQTGEELAWDYYIERDPLSQWGYPGMNASQLGHRATKCMWTVAYLDGKHPSFVNSRGIYHRTKLEAWDWDGTNLTKRWAFDSGDSGEYYGQGNHNLSCADVDDDGRDEIVYGSMTVDHDGNGLYSTGTGHGDAIHVSDMDPDRPGLEIWNCLESSMGTTYRDAKTGEILIRYRSNRDCGRCAAGDISAETDGFELWGAAECPMYDTEGNVVGESNVPMNFMIWWDGDKMREFQDHAFNSTTGIGVPVISKYDEGLKDNYAVLTATGTTTNNWTKGTPCLQADIFGDWREEMMVRTTDNTALRIFTTTDYTDYRMPTLMHEPQYRIAVAWQNNSYNQPPHTAIYLGNETEDAVPYPMSNGKTVWVSGPDFGSGSANWQDEDGNSVTYSNDQHILFDYTGDNSSDVNLVSTVSPKSVTVHSFEDYTFSGTGQLSGSMELLKAGTGMLTLDNANDFTGTTKLYYGGLLVNNTLANSNVEVCMFGELYLNGTLGNGLLVKSHGKFNIGNQENAVATVSIQNGLELNKGSKTYFDLSSTFDGSNDQVNLSGNVIVNGACSLIFNRLEGVLNPGDYDLITFDGEFQGSIDDLTIVGLNDVACELLVANGKLTLRVLEVRSATSIVWAGGVNNIWDFAGAENWDNNGVADWFLGNDEVTFNDEGAQTSVDITEIVPIGSMIVEGTQDYTFDGAGMISGTGGLVKNGTGKLLVNNVNDFTGPVALNGGYVQVDYISNGGQSGPLGASAKDAANFTIDGSILSVVGNITATDRSFTIGDKNATLYVNGESLTVDGQFTGTGELVKEGNGTLILNESSSHTATQINSGTLKLNTENANLSGLGSKVTIKDAMLQMFNSTGSYSDINWDIEVPSGYSATIGLDGRCTMNGALTGGGTVVLNTPYVRPELLGDWSAFTGQINAITTSNGWLILGNANGYAASSIDLGDNVFGVYRHSTDATIEIGELTGSSSSVLGSGGEASNTITWKIGGKNTSVQFDGRITNSQFKNSGSQAAIIKTGSGRWTLTNASTYTGGTSIERGTLIVSNTSGSATGTGAIVVNRSSALAGTGSVSGAVTVKSRGYLMPGLTSTLGILTINNDVTLEDGSICYMKMDAGAMANDKIYSSGTVNVSGTLTLSLINGTYTSGQAYKILDVNAINGEFTAISPATPWDGLYWDTSSLYVNGILRVTDVPTSIFNPEISSVFNVYPNPAENFVWINLPEVDGEARVEICNISGRTLQSKVITISGETKLELDNLNAGLYIIWIEVNGKLFHSKLIVK